MFGAAHANSIRKELKSDSNSPQSAHDENSMGLMQVPDWVCTVLKAPAPSISQAQVDNVPSGNQCGPPGTKELYPVLLSYFSHYAVNVDETIRVTDSNTVTDLKSNKRQGAGRLSSLWYAINDFMLSPPNQDPEWSDDEEQNRGGSKKNTVPPKAIFQFGLGTARIEINGKPICIIHKAIGPAVALRDSVIMPRQLHLFAKDAETIQELCDTAFDWDFIRTRDNASRPGQYKLYTLSVSCGDAWWHNEGNKTSRSLESIILPPGMLDSIVEDFREFAADDTEAWYISHGLPHRRSYLFYGPPGVGKTSTIRALAGALELSACFLSLGNYNIGNKQLQDALRGIPKPSMLVIEDIDALFNEKRKSKNQSTLTFSGLLNSLDGLVAADGILTVMTTNHIEKLDPALIRAGRVDRRFEFKPPGHEQIKGLFLSFYPDAADELATDFADVVFKRPEKDARSIATLQEHFIFTRRKNARESVDSVDKFFTMFFPQKEEKKNEKGDHICS